MVKTVTNAKSCTGIKTLDNNNNTKTNVIELEVSSNAPTSNSGCFLFFHDNKLKVRINGTEYTLKP